MHLATLERDRHALVAEARKLASMDALSDDNMTRLADLRHEIETRDKAIETIRYTEALDSAATQPVDDHQFVRQCRQFRIQNIVAHQVKPHSVDAGLELEVSSEMERRGRLQGRSYAGIAMPWEVFDVPNTRAPVYSTAVQGTEDYRPGDYINALRDRLILTELGVRTIAGLAGNLELPKANAVARAAWAAETASLAETTPSYTSITATPHKLGAWTEFSQLADIQASPDLESLIRNDLAMAMSIALNDAFLTGSGQAPTGISHITAFKVDRSGDTNGKVLTFAELETLVRTVDEANVPMDSRAWIASTREKFFCMGLPRFASNGDRGVEIAYTGGNILGDRAVVTNAVSTAVTHGSSGITSSLYYGNFSDAIFAQWQGIDLLVNPYADTPYKRGTIMLRATMYADFQFRHDEAIRFYDAII